MNTIEVFLDSWPDETRAIAREVVEKYGEPDESTTTRLIWHARGPWQEIVVYRDFVEHAYPARHIDAFEGTLRFKLTASEVANLARFNGCISCCQTRRTMTIYCQNEEVALLIATFAYYLVRKNISSVQVRKKFYEAYESLDKASPVAEAVSYYFS